MADKTSIAIEVITIFHNHKLTFKQAYTVLDEVKVALEEVKNETKICINKDPSALA